MRFRTRLALAFAAATVIPLGLLGYGVRREMTRRLDAQANQRIEALVSVLRNDLTGRTDRLRTQLRTLAAGLETDNRFRLATGVANAPERSWLLDWAGEAMAAGGLTLLRVLDSAGTVLSSGHFRNEFGRLDPGLTAALSTVHRGPALVRLPAADGDIQALAAVDSFSVAGRRYYLVGGVPFDAATAAALVPQDEITVSLVGEGQRQPGAAVTIPIPHYDALDNGSVTTSALVIIRDPRPMQDLRVRVDRWLVLTAGAMLLLAVLFGLLMAAMLSRPLARLAEKTSQVDLDQLDQDFAMERKDEIGALGNLLAAMTTRLRQSAIRLREAERRAATGDLARQINHDVKNGLAPIRHVLRHLADTSQKHPEQLPAIFAERRQTLESSVAYLEDLARNYARLAPAIDRGATDVSALLMDVARASAVDGVEFHVDAPAHLPPVRADGVALRRIVENLVSNAIDALEGQPGVVTLVSQLVSSNHEQRIRLSVSDTGRGMSAQELEQAFDDFHTTKPAGTGLGLSVVRRLVNDLGGTLRVETGPGKGSTFSVEIHTA